VCKHATISNNEFIILRFLFVDDDDILLCLVSHYVRLCAQLKEAQVRAIALVTDACVALVVWFLMCSCMVPSGKSRKESCGE
jgi:hypothetical protein